MSGVTKFTTSRVLSYCFPLKQSKKLFFLSLLFFSRHDSSWWRHKQIIGSIIQNRLPCFLAQSFPFLSTTVSLFSLLATISLSFSLCLILSYSLAFLMLVTFIIYLSHSLFLFLMLSISLIHSHSLTLFYLWLGFFFSLSFSSSLTLPHFLAFPFTIFLFPASLALYHSPSIYFFLSLFLLFHPFHVIVKTFLLFLFCALKSGDSVLFHDGKRQKDRLSLIIIG